MAEQTVWIVNFSGHDYSDAERFGEIEFITQGYVPRDRLDRMLGTVAERIANSGPNDWLLPSGLIPLNVLAGACWLKKHDTLRLLLWDDKTNRYRTMEVGEDHIPHLLRQYGGGDGNRRRPTDEEADQRRDRKESA